MHSTAGREELDILNVNHNCQKYKISREPFIVSVSQLRYLNSLHSSSHWFQYCILRNSINASTRLPLQFVIRKCIRVWKKLDTWTTVSIKSIIQRDKLIAHWLKNTSNIPFYESIFRFLNKNTCIQSHEIHWS